MTIVITGVFDERVFCLAPLGSCPIPFVSHYSYEVSFEAGASGNKTSRDFVLYMYAKPFCRNRVEMTRRASEVLVETVVNNIKVARYLR